MKMPSYKNIGTQIITVCKCSKYRKTETETPFISQIYKYINIFKGKSNFVVEFTSMFSCFRRPGSLFLPQVLN